MTFTPTAGQQTVNYSLELIVVPVSDIDRAKQFYVEKMGFHVHVDVSPREDFRIVQLTPPGSACSIALMRSEDRPGTLGGLHLIVEDIELAQREFSERSTEVVGPFHFEQGRQVDGPHPARESYNTFISLDDPDGNGWMVQEVRR